MELQKIISGKEKTQILHIGFRFQHNKGPQGPNQTTYFTCVEKGCRATLATCGALEGELALKFHRDHAHNHRADVSANIVSSTLSEFREEMNSNPERHAKQLFEEVTQKALDSVVVVLTNKTPISRGERLEIPAG